MLPIMPVRIDTWTMRATAMTPTTMSTIAPSRSDQGHRLEPRQPGRDGAGAPGPGQLDPWTAAPAADLALHAAGLEAHPGVIPAQAGFSSFGCQPLEVQLDPPLSGVTEMVGIRIPTRL